MNSSERRENNRRQTDVGVSIFKQEETIPATVVDLCDGGFGLHCRRAFFPGAEIYLKLDDVNDFGIYGTVKWAVLQNVNNEISYRMGIDVERIVRQPGDGGLEVSCLPECIEKLMTEIKS